MNITPPASIKRKMGASLMRNRSASCLPQGKIVHLPPPLRAVPFCLATSIRTSADGEPWDIFIGESNFFFNIINQPTQSWPTHNTNCWSVCGSIEKKVRDLLHFVEVVPGMRYQGRNLIRGHSQLDHGYRTSNGCYFLTPTVPPITQ